MRCTVLATSFSQPIFDSARTWLWKCHSHLCVSQLHGPNDRRERMDVSDVLYSFCVEKTDTSPICTPWEAIVTISCFSRLSTLLRMITDGTFSAFSLIIRFECWR